MLLAGSGVAFTSQEARPLSPASFRCLHTYVHFKVELQLGSAVDGPGPGTGGWNPSLVNEVASRRAGSSPLCSVLVKLTLEAIIHRKRQKRTPTPGTINQFAPTASNLTMNPYVSDPDQIPATDQYADVPFYGRYLPRPDDFHVDPRHVNSY